MVWVLSCCFLGLGLVRMREMGLLRWELGLLMGDWRLGSWLLVPESWRLQGSWLVLENWRVLQGSWVQEQGHQRASSQTWQQFRQDKPRLRNRH